MDAWSDDSVERVTVKASTQIGKTSAWLNCLGWSVDQDHGPALVVMPTEESARGISKKRVLPMFEDSPVLRDQMPRKADDKGAMAYYFDDMIVNFGWSNSPTSLASNSIRYLIFDEADKYPACSGNEADPIKLGEERTRTYKLRRKIYSDSTPTTRTGYIHREFEKSDQRTFHVPCPHCGEYQRLLFPRIKSEPNRTPAELREDPMLAWYECGGCAGRIDDRHKEEMLLRVVDCPDGCRVNRLGRIEGEIPRTSHRGFWINALYSPWLTFADIKAEHEESKDNPDTLKNFVNSWLAELWEERIEIVQAHMLETKRTALAATVVPKDALGLTAGVDVQIDRLYGVVMAWGLAESSCMIREFWVDSFEEMALELEGGVFKREGAEAVALPVRLVCIDARYRTDEVYQFCRKRREQFRPVMGYDRLNGSPFQVSLIDKNYRGKPLPGSMQMWRLDTSYFKDKTARFVSALPGDPGCMRVHADVSPEYLAHMGSEHKVLKRNAKTGRDEEEWLPVKQGVPNHLWDATIYAVAAGNMLNVATWRKQERAAPPPASSGQSDWIGGTERWLDR
jgi:phage terminase large subunit GpA-like protein